MTLSARALQVSIGRHRVCNGLDCDIAPGQRWGVLGINGAGKTTLLSTLAGLRPADAGTLTLGGVALDALAPRERALQLGVMPQDDHDDPETTVLETVLLGRLPHLRWWQAESRRDIEFARMALTTVGLQHMSARRAATLSGGERRRLALAVLLVQEAPLWLLDEPTSHLDLHQQIALLDLLTQLPQRTLVMVLHDINLAARYCTHLLLLFGNGEAEAGPAARMLDTAILSRLYRHTVCAVDTPRGKLYFPD